MKTAGDECGVVPLQDRIAGGEEADENSIPWIAHLNLTYENDGDWRGDCGAVILSPKYVITVANCLMKWTQNDNGSWTAKRLTNGHMKVRIL